jgi:excisionase family DNA binding protein
MKKPLLKPKAVAAQLDLGLTFVYLMLKSGKLPSIRLGTGPRARYRIDPEVLEAWLAKRRTKADRSTRLSAMTREEECARLGIPVDHEFTH